MASPGPADGSAGSYLHVVDVASRVLLQPGTEKKGVCLYSVCEPWAVSSEHSIVCRVSFQKSLSSEHSRRRWVSTQNVGEWELEPVGE